MLVLPEQVRANGSDTFPRIAPIQGNGHLQGRIVAHILIGNEHNGLALIVL